MNNTNKPEYKSHSRHYAQNDSCGIDSGISSWDIPQGLARAFCQNAAAMTAFANLPCEDKREILDMARHISSQKDMIALAQNISIHNLP